MTANKAARQNLRYFLFKVGMTKINQRNKIHRYGKFVSMMNSSKRLNFSIFSSPFYFLQGKKAFKTNRHFFKSQKSINFSQPIK